MNPIHRTTVVEARRNYTAHGLRAPHHTSSLPSIVGSITRRGPGDYTFNLGELHQGRVLLLTDLPEWKTATLKGIGAALSPDGPGRRSQGRYR